ncbi:MAG: hypothetical protein GC154_13300 [bacterium]|nr:hypothetical protein [bacterium]
MRNFRFRLDPVLRLKRYEIEEKERVIQRLENQIQGLLNEIEEGRLGVQAFRERLIDRSSDDEYLALQKTLDMYRAFMMRTERDKRGQIARIRQEQNERRQELIGLYQEEKILEKYKEKKLNDWTKETQKEEAAIMDEIGTRKYIRNRRESGGVLLYLLVPLLLVGAAAGVAWYMGVVDQEMLRKIPLPYFQNLGGPASATAAVQSATSIAVPEAYTAKDLFGDDPNKPLPDILKNIIVEQQKLRDLKLALDDKQKELQRWENSLQNKEQALSGYVSEASDQLITLQELERKRQEREKSELSQLEDKVSTVLSLSKPKEVSGLIVQMYQASSVASPEEQREQQLRVIRILRGMPEKAFSSMMAQLQKENPVVAAQMLNDYMALTTEELYGVTAPSAASATESATDTASSVP